MPSHGRRWRIPRSSLALVALLSLVVAGALITVIVLYVREHVALERTIDDLTALQEDQGGELDRINASRREAILIVCKETEGLKLDVRVVLERFGVQPRTLPLNPRTGRRAFAPVDCATRSLELVPPPASRRGKDLGVR